MAQVVIPATYVEDSRLSSGSRCQPSLVSVFIGIWGVSRWIDFCLSTGKYSKKIRIFCYDDCKEAVADFLQLMSLWNGC